MQCRTDVARADRRQKSKHSVEVFALRYGKSLYPAKLVNHEQKAGKVPLDWLFYLLKDSRGYNILVDTGFQNKKYARQFSIRDFFTASQLLGKIDMKPDDITDVVITHAHFDHIEGVSQFQKARIYIQQTEYEQFKRSKDYSAHKKFFLAAEKDKRLKHEPDAMLTQSGNYYQTILTGGHTKGSQVLVMKANKEIIFTGDECYFAEYCSAQYFLPAGARYSLENNQKAFRLFQGKIVLTPHDPKIFEDDSTHVKRVCEVQFGETKTAHD